MKLAMILLGCSVLLSGSPVEPVSFDSVIVAPGGASMSLAQDKQDGVPQWHDLFNGKDLTGWVPVNVDKDTFTARDGMIVCNGKPIGVMRTDKMFENFI